MAGVLLLAGCASPGPPRAPSLQLPAVVSDLTALRRGAAVELQFAMPARTSDGVPYRGVSVRATVCRAVEAGSCVPLAALTGVSVTGSASGAAGMLARATLQDELPAGLAAGPVRLLTYRMELLNPVGRTAGFGDAAYAAAGAAPQAVAGLHAQGSRAGVAVRWQPQKAGQAAGPDAESSGSEVVLRRELVSGNTAAAESGKPKLGRSAKDSTNSGGPRAQPDVVLLATAPLGDPLQPTAGSEVAADSGVAAHERLATATANGALDDSAAIGSTYRYAAERQQTAQLGGHTLVLHSELSTPVDVTLRAVYPPPAPLDLVGTVFPMATVDDPASMAASELKLAVDLIWTPAEDAVSPAQRTVGYLVFREGLDATGKPAGERVQLTATPVRMPAFHEVLPASFSNAASGAGSQRLRYSVVAIDAGGLQSAAVTTVVETSGR